MTNENENTTTTQNSNEIIAEEKPKQITIGELLKTKRQERNLTLKVISQQTKIHISLLENIESNNLAALPSKAYVQGFVRSTAKILNIDPKLALAALEYTYNPLAVNKASLAAQSRKKQVENEHEKEDFKNKESILLAQNFIAKHIGLASKVGVVLILVGGIVFYIADYIQKLPPPVVVQEQVEEESTNSSIDANGVVKVEEVPATPEVVIENTATTPEVKVEIKPEEKVEVKPEVEKEAIDAKTLKQVKLTTVSASEVQFEDLDLTTEDYNELLPARFRVGLAANTHAIFLNASKGDSWITYKVDDKEIKKFVLRQGRTLFIRGNTIRLFLGNSSSLNVFYNNKPVNIISRGKSTVKNVVVPEEKRASYKTPLFIFNDDGTVLTSDEYEKLINSQVL